MFDENGTPPGKFPSLTDDTGLLCWRDGVSSFTGLRLDPVNNPSCLPPPWEPVPECLTGDYWASTIAGYDYESERWMAWAVNFEYGDVFPNYVDMENVFFVWPVRDTISSPPVPLLSCIGFEPPLAAGKVKVRGNRALPLKAQLFGSDGGLMTDLNLTTPPVIQVWFEYGAPEADDVSDEALPTGQSTEGNQFFFDSDERWHYNLKTKNYSASGTYTIFMDSGDGSEYITDPTCAASFVVE